MESSRNHLFSFLWGAFGTATIVGIVALLYSYWLPPLLLAVFTNRPDVFQAGIDSIGKSQEVSKLNVVRGMSPAEISSISTPFGQARPSAREGSLVVEFSDYRCGYCRVADKQLRAVANQGKIRLVVRELPILGAQSELAAKYALAASLQGKYDTVRAQLLQASEINPESIAAILGKAGLDVAKAHADAESDMIKAEIDRNKSLASKIGIQGTPAFIVGRHFIGGFNMQEIMSAATSSSIDK